MSLLRAGCQPSPVWLREQNLGKTQLQAGHPAHLFLSFRRIRLSATADGFAGNWKILTGCFPGARRVASCHSPCPGLDYSGPSGQILEAWPSGPRTFWDSPVIYPRVKNLWVKLSFDKEGMPGSDSGPRQGWLESARDFQSAAFLDHPVLIRGGEFKSPGSQAPE